MTISDLIFSWIVRFLIVNFDNFDLTEKNKGMKLKKTFLPLACIKLPSVVLKLAYDEVLEAIDKGSGLE